MNLLSASLSASACGMFSVVAHRLLTMRPGRTFRGERDRRNAGGVNGERRSRIAGWSCLAAGWLLGIGPAIWWQSVIAEKYSMNLFFAVGLTAVVLAAAGKPRRPKSLLAGMGLIFGLSASHHGQTIYFLPAVALAGWWVVAGVLPRAARFRAVFVFLLMLVLGLSLKLIYPPVVAQRLPLEGWGNPGSWPGYVEYISGQVFKHRIMHWSPVELATRTLRHLGHGVWLPGHFGPAGFVAGLLGLILLARARPRETALLASAWAAGVVYCLTFSLEGIAIRTYYIPTFLVFGFFVAAGLAGVGEWLGGKLPCGVWVKVSIIAGALALGWPLGPNYAGADRSRHYFAYDFSRALLRSVAPGSLLVAWGDYDLFPLWYQHDVLGRRRDVRIVNAKQLPLRTVRELGHRTPAASRPVYHSIVHEAITDLPLLPRGAAYLVLQDRTRLATADVMAEWRRYRRWRTLRGVYDRSVVKDHNTRYALSYHAYIAYRRGYVLSFRTGGCRSAVDLYDAALDWPFWRGARGDFRGRAGAYTSRGRCRETLGDPAGARSDYREAVRLAPDWSVPARELASFLWRRGRISEASRMYLRVLELDPDDAEVRRMVGPRRR